MKMNIAFAALIAAHLAACGQQEQATEEAQAPVANEAPVEAPAMEAAPAEAPATDAGMEAAPVEGEAPSLEGLEEPAEEETEATEEPPVG